MSERGTHLTYHHDGQGLTERCLVVVADDPHPVNGAHHLYRLKRELAENEPSGDLEGDYFGVCEVGRIQFQRGPRNVPDSTPGTLDGALLSILIHRQECFQAGPFSCPENEAVLYHLREAMRLTIERAQERARRGVLGQNVK